MRASRYVVLTVVLGLAFLVGTPRAQEPQTTFHGIGDLPEGTGGVGSAVRDATRVGGTIYAVGSSTTYATAMLPAVPTLDTPALWTLLAGSASGTLTALPAGAAYPDPPGFLATAKTAYQITPLAAYIASQAQYLRADGVRPTRWVRVDRNLLASADPRIANLDLSSTGTSGTTALAISESGGVIFGQTTNNATATSPETRVPVRHEPGLGPNFPDLTPTGKTWGFPIPRGTSADGLVMVGVASDGAVVLTTTGVAPNQVFSTNAVAFRYEHTAGTLTGTTTLIPLLEGGTWNMPAALSGDETVVDQTVVIGNSTAFPNGEVYLTNAANAITATLGSPNTAMMPRPLGGMTADGNVVAVTFSGGSGFGAGQPSGLGITPGNKSAYIHNSHGWFRFSSILAAQSVDLVAMGWNPANLAITGVRTVEGVDLVFGQGERRTVDASGYVDGTGEGFVAELPAGVLATFNPTPTPPSDQSFVGAWAIGDPTNPTNVVTHLANGTYVRISSSGFERGLYNWTGNPAGGAITFTTLSDTDGNAGLSSLNGFLGLTLTVAGDTATRVDTNCATCTSVTLTRIMDGPGSIAGGWVLGNPTEPDSSVVLVFTSDGKYFFAGDGNRDSIEMGTFTWDAASGLLVPNVDPSQGDVDQNGDGGLYAGPGFTVTANLTANGLALLVDDGTGVFQFNRVIDPATIPVITNPQLSASGVVGQAFSYDVDATNTATFTATGLPDGLSINSNSGEISGTPSVGGQFAVTLKATSASGVSDIETLTLTIAIPTPVGQNVVVEPDVPEGAAPITLSFEEIAAAGTTTVEVLDAETSPPPPGGFQIGDQAFYYEVTTDVILAPNTSVTICFDIAGVDFGGETPRLFHFESGQWVNITTSLNTETQTLCGSTSSFSPFAIFSSPNSAALKSVGEARAWIGLKNSDDQGTRFDLLAELYKGSSLITSGLTRCIAGVTRNANNALSVGVPFEPFAQSESVPLAPGDAFTVRLSTRIGTNANGTKCTGHNSATGLRLYYDGTTRPSGVGAQILPAEFATYFLHSVGTTHVLNVQSPTGAAKFKDSPAVNFSGGNVWKTIGDWTLFVP